MLHKPAVEAGLLPLGEPSKADAAKAARIAGRIEALAKVVSLSPRTEREVFTTHRRRKISPSGRNDIYRHFHTFARGSDKRQLLMKRLEKSTLNNPVFCLDTGVHFTFHLISVVLFNNSGKT